MSATIVGCYYNLKESKHSIKDYNKWISNFLMIETPKIIFTNKETYSEYFKDYSNENTFFVLKEFEEFKTWKYIDKFKEHFELDPEKNIHNIYLYLLWNEKTEFLKNSANIDKFKTEYFIYCDMGCFRKKDLMRYYIKWPNNKIIKKIKKVTLLLTNNFDKQDLIIKDNGLPGSFLYKNRIGGGIICVPKNQINIWHEKYYYILEKFIKNNRFIGKDQSIMATVCILYPNILELIPAKKSKYCIDEWFYLQPYLHGLV